MRTRIRLDDEAAIFDGDAYLRSGFEAQEIEEHGREREHDGTADFTKTRCMHWITLLYSSITQMLEGRPGCRWFAGIRYAAV